MRNALHIQPSPIRVLIADDSAAVRRELSGLLQIAEDLNVIAECCDGESAVGEALSLRPDVAVLDLEMPGCDGCQAARTISRTLTGCRLVALTVHSSADDRRRALDAGFDVVVIKGAPLAELLGAIRSRSTTVPAPVGPKAADHSPKGDLS